MKIEISKTNTLTIETFTNKANHGESFSGIRFRIGKRKPKTLFHMHHSKGLTIIDALQSCMASINNDKGSFYESPAWQSLRYETLKKYRKCCLCGNADKLNVDHIKPRSKYPELALDPKNLQTLCQRCNLAKSNSDSEDFGKRLLIKKT